MSPGDDEGPVHIRGLILGHAVSPIVHRGDALVHIARDDVDHPKSIAADEGTE